MTSPLESPPSIFYRVNTLHVPLAQLRGVVGGGAAFVRGAILKLLRIRMPHLYAADPTAIELVPTVPAGSRASIMLEESVRACRDVGLVEQFAFRVPQLTPTENLAVLFATADRRVLAVANATIATVGEQTSAGVSMLCWSRLDEERRITTCTFAGLAPPAPWDDREVMRGRSVGAITARHRQRIAARDLLPFSPEKSGIMHEFLRMNRKDTDNLIALGILEPMTTDEVISVRSQLAAAG